MKRHARLALLSISLLSGLTLGWLTNPEIASASGSSTVTCENDACYGGTVCGALPPWITGLGCNALGGGRCETYNC